MKVLLHDLEEEEFEKIFPNIGEDITIVSKNAPIHNCIGCFGCWIKTPGACVIRDKYGDMGKLLSKCNELQIISECFYGGYSSFVKNVIDRSISYVHPYFIIRDGQMHHKSRYNNRFDLKVWFYGNSSLEEKETAQKLVSANGINLNSKSNIISFFNNVKDMEGELL